MLAALFGVLLAGESLMHRAWLGCGPIVAGMVLAELWPRGSPTAPATPTAPALDPS